MLLSNKYKILFLVFVVLGIYYPTIFAGVNSIDDTRMISGIANQTVVNWKSVFLPSSSLYYRPLLISSYVADRYLWDLSESFMHLENVLLHAANTVLVFLIATKVLIRQSSRQLELPFISALLFALHPINTESVDWISGRTDPLAAFFVLLSLLMLLKGTREERYPYLVLSTFFLLLGCMSKEVAVFFLPCACFLAICRQEGEFRLPAAVFSAVKLRQLAVLVAPFAVCGLVYVYLRFTSFSTPGKLQQIFTGSDQILNSLRIIFKVFGFYVKKLVFPWPLNFAIVEVNNQYVWLGIAAFALAVVLAWRRQMVGGMLLTAFFLITPSLLVALSFVTWTPAAERYLYLPCAFFAIGSIGTLGAFAEKIARPTAFTSALFLLLLPVAFFTYQRNIIWQSNLALYQDTQKKSPQFLSIRNELALALAHSGNRAEAERQLELARNLDPQKKNVLLYVNQAELRVASGKTMEGRALILEVIPESGPVNPEALKMLAHIDEKRLFDTQSEQSRRELYAELLKTHERIFRIDGEAMHLYRAGQMALFLNERSKAALLFEKAYHVAPQDAYFRPAAKKMSEKLRQ